MAVQAQYPSNVLLLNRNGQEMKNTIGNEYLMQTQQQQHQQQQGGFLLDQSHMLFNNNNGVLGVNPRKRARESNINVGSNDLTIQINKQRDEIDQYLQLQGDQLRRTLAERRKEHYRALVGVAEESARTRLREKEAEVEKATRRNAELEQRVAQLRVEAQVWHHKARNQEANAASLQLQLQQAMLMQGAQDNNNRREEGVGCSGEGEAEDAESAHIDPERAVMMMSGPSCKACQGRVASVVLLPCRHLCLCTNCNAGVDTCPVCLSFSSSSVEVFLS
ncbi:Boi-related e3 ubiquitin-protein ligase [Thalictrum thalictroides]|uniref:Boi-related e3 ubiquitin-protein ligase n=1 Tax=Thalictrum thalictroides TaxID=46969 RepID=A0A7J6V577_THATH|nr:Boi-related e3 ubiquitin-protein ligase [Thalictrum thalictroides]